MPGMAIRKWCVKLALGPPRCHPWCRIVNAADPAGTIARRCDRLARRCVPAVHAAHAPASRLGHAKHPPSRRVDAPPRGAAVPGSRAARRLRDATSGRTNDGRAARSRARLVPPRPARSSIMRRSITRCRQARHGLLRVRLRSRDPRRAALPRRPARRVHPCDRVGRARPRRCARGGGGARSSATASRARRSRRSPRSSACRPSTRITITSPPRAARDAAVAHALADPRHRLSHVARTR